MTHNKMDRSVTKDEIELVIARIGQTWPKSINLLIGDKQYTKEDILDILNGMRRAYNAC